MNARVGVHLGCLAVSCPSIQPNGTTANASVKNLVRESALLARMGAVATHHPQPSEWNFQLSSEAVTRKS